ncbi:MAG: sulfotransferase [Myxococcales bacterium]|nr:sulfotransferase [Myxococcales bacterium]
MNHPDTSKAKVHFVLLGHPRSGSTLLLNALREHPGVQAFGEIFQDEPEERRSQLGGLFASYENGMDGAAYLRTHVFHARDDEDLLAIGFKLFYFQAREKPAATAWQYLIDEPRIRIVHLSRAQGVEAFVSLCEAEATGKWHVELDEPPAPTPTPVHVDPEACLAFLDKVQVHNAWVRQAFCKHDVLDLSYERLVRDFSRSLSDVQTFLELPCQSLPLLLRKQGTRPLHHRIANFEELRRRLRHTLHALDT